jgi:mannose-6-phosphate isomerase-like protein (cupin superfamily)
LRPARIALASKPTSQIPKFLVKGAIEMKNTLTASFVALLTLALSSCSGHWRHGHDHPAVVVPPDEGSVRWWTPASADELGDGAVFNVKIDRVSVPYANLMVSSQTTAVSGIPVHLHTFEEELLYIVDGNGFAIVGEDRRQIPVEPGSVIYIPIGQWHGLRNAEPDRRMEVLVVTTPVQKNGLGDFFLEVGTEPGHPPLNVPEEEFRALFRKYGMELPAD